MTDSDQYAEGNDHPATVADSADKTLQEWATPSGRFIAGPLMALLPIVFLAVVLLLLADLEGLALLIIGLTVGLAVLGLVAETIVGLLAYSTVVVAGVLGGFFGENYRQSTYSEIAIAALVLVGAFSGAGFVMFGGPMQTVNDELFAGVAVGETVENGADVVASLEYSSSLKVTLTAPAGELGVTKLHLYNGDNRIASRDLDPRQTEATLYQMPFDETASWTLVAVDGSNKVISEVQIEFKEVQWNE